MFDITNQIRKILDRKKRITDLPLIHERMGRFEKISSTQSRYTNDLRSVRMAIMINTSMFFRNFIKMDFFDLDLEEDSAFYVDIFSLKETDITEFQSSFKDFLQYFKQVTGLIKFKKNTEAEKKLMFKEINGFKLGFASKKSKSKKSRGAGIGKELPKKISLSIQDLIKAGEERPEIFSLLPFCLIFGVND